MPIHDAEADTEARNLDVVRRALAAVAAGATGDDLAAFFHPQVVQQELPNRLYPAGQTRDLAALLASAARGREVIREQRYDVRSALARGDQVALEVAWSGTLAVPFGAVPAGHTMRATLAMFIELRDGRIYRQRNYDCYDAF
jgi:ketosteroid isomerase-like protein